MTRPPIGCPQSGLVEEYVPAICVPVSLITPEMFPGHSVSGEVSTADMLEPSTATPPVRAPFFAGPPLANAIAHVPVKRDPAAAIESWRLALSRPRFMDPFHVPT